MPDLPTSWSHSSSSSGKLSKLPTLERLATLMRFFPLLRKMGDAEPPTTLRLVCAVLRGSEVRRRRISACRGFSTAGTGADGSSSSYSTGKVPDVGERGKGKPLLSNGERSDSSGGAVANSEPPDEVEAIETSEVGRTARAGLCSKSSQLPQSHVSMPTAPPARQAPVAPCIAPGRPLHRPRCPAAALRGASARKTHPS